MALYVTGAETTEGDSILFSRLLDKLEDGLFSRVVNLLRYNGIWSANGLSVPSGLGGRRKQQYEMLLDMSRLNLARPMVSAVESRQRPNGFRKVNDETMRSTDANDTFMRNHLQLKTMQGNHDVALYGSSYLLVADNGFGESIHYVDPWRAITSVNGECGIVYTYDELCEVETVSFYRMTFNLDGSVARVYKRDAERRHARTVVFPDDDLETLKNIAIAGRTTHGWDHEDGFAWVGDPVDYPYAVDCHTLPLLQRHTPDGMSILEPHWATMDRINQKIFDQLVIGMLQAFKQRAITGIQRSYYQEDDIEVIQGVKKAGDPVDWEQNFPMTPASLWALPEGVDIWESGTVDITPLDTAVGNDIKRLATTTGIPLDVLSPDVQGSAEGASLKRESLTFFVEQLNMLTNDVMCRAITMALVIDGKAQVDVDQFEMMWLPADPQPITELAQAASQLVNVLPKKTIMKQILNMTETQTQEALRDATDEHFNEVATGANLPTNTFLTDSFNDPLPDNTPQGANVLNLTVNNPQGNETVDTTQRE